MKIVIKTIHLDRFDCSLIAGALMVQLIHGYGWQVAVGWLAAVALSQWVTDD